MLKIFPKSLNSVKYKYLSSTILMMLVFILFFTYFWYSNATSDAEEASILYVGELLRNSNESFEASLKDIYEIVSLAGAQDSEIENYLSNKHFKSERDELESTRNISKYVKDLYGFKYYISGISIIDADNRQFSFGITLPTDYQIRQPWYVDVLHSKGNTVFIPPHFNDTSSAKNPPGVYRDMVISIGKSIMFGNTLLGTIIADMRCDILFKNFDLNLKDKGSVIVFDNTRNKFIFMPEQERLPEGFNEIEFKKAVSHLDSDSGNFHAKIGNNDFLLIYYQSRLTKWTTIGLVSKKKLLEKFDKTKNKTLLLALIFFIISSVISLLISSLLTRNLLKLNKAMGKFGKGSLGISVKIKSRDEVGQLYQQFNSMVASIKQLFEELKITEYEKRKAEIIALQSQINPHFLYNTLNTIKVLSVLQGVDSIKKVTESLSKLLHAYMSHKSFIKIREEMEYIKSYLSIQEYKYSDKFTWDTYIEEGLEDYMLPKLILQPIVENSLAHGISSSRNFGVVSIKIFQENDTLKIRIQDNGVGMSKEMIGDIMNNRLQSKGIGIQNVISRMHLYFNSHYRISILSQENIYCIFELTLPLLNEKEAEQYA